MKALVASYRLGLSGAPALIAENANRHLQLSFLNSRGQTGAVEETFQKFRDEFTDGAATG